MSTIKVRGVVIKESFTGEADKFITILCKDQGKIRAYAKGARNTNSKFLAGTQLFSYADFVLYERNDFLSVAQIDPIENFYKIRNHFEKLCCGSYLFELVDRNILPNEPCNDLMQILLKSLANLKKKNTEPGLIARIFELKFLEYEGYMPELNGCVVCGAMILGEMYFMREGIACPKCIGKEKAHRINSVTLRTIKYICTSERKDLFQFSVSKEVLKEMKAVSKIYMKEDYPYKSLELNEGDGTL